MIGSRPFAVLMLLLMGVASLRAQPPGEVDPFAVPPAEATPAPAAAPPAPAAAAAALAQSEHPLLQELRATNPTTPVELMRAIGIALDLGEYAAAKEFMQKVQSAGMNTGEVAALVREVGSAAFVRIGRTKELEPEGQQFALAALRAADAVARDPVRLQTVVERLGDPSPIMQRTAIRELQRAGSAAVTPLVRVLANPIQRDIHPQARAALYYLGAPAVEPLLAVLEAPDPALRVHAIDVLGRLEAKDALHLLVGPAVNPQEYAAVREAALLTLERMIGRRPHPADARDLLAARVTELMDGELPRRPDVDGRIELWHWDVRQTAPVPQRYPADEAGAVLAARLARNLYAISPDHPAHRRLYLEAILGAAKIQTGLHLPLPRGDGTAHAAAAALGSEAVEDALHHALKKGRIPAAIAAAEVLGDIGTSAVVQSGSAIPAPLTAALMHPNQRVQFAAAEAIAKINPRHPFPGAARYIATLARFARTEVTPRVLVADPRGEISQTLAGLLTQMGYEAEPAFTGRQAYEMASRHPDYAFLLLSDALNDPPVDQLVQLLRQDFRTANLPIGVLYRIEVEPIHYTLDTFEQLEAATQTGDPVPGLRYKEHRLLDARRIAAGDRLTEAFPQVYEPATLDPVTRRLVTLAGGDIVTPPERIHFARVALDALGRYAADPVRYGFYHVVSVEDSLIKAVNQTELALPALHALGQLGTAAAQRTLVDTASQHARPLEVRQAAAAAFRVAVARQHLQLTTQEILLQYNRYNLSERHDRETQLVLGSVLDTIEGGGKEPPAALTPDVEASPPSS